MLGARLLAQAELADQRRVALAVGVLQVRQQALAAIDHAQQATAAVVVLGMGLEVGRELVDASGEQGHLHFGAAGVAGATRVRGDDLGLVQGGHGISLVGGLTCVAAGRAATCAPRPTGRRTANCIRTGALGRPTSLSAVPKTVIPGLTRDPATAAALAAHWTAGQARNDRAATDYRCRPSQACRRRTPSSRRPGSLDAKHQRSQPCASGANALPGAMPSPASATRRLASASESPKPSSWKNAYMPPRGMASSTRGSACSWGTSRSRQAFRWATTRGVTSSVRCTATTAARCVNTLAHEVLNSISLPMPCVIAAGMTIQPSRHPVIRKLFEKLCATTS